MNNLKNTGFLLVLAFLITFSSCQKEAKFEDKAIEALPTNATMVTALDIPALMKKANFEEVKQMEFYQFFAEEAKNKSDILAAVFANPENAGIDLTKNAYIAIELSPDNPEQIFTGIVFNLTSSDDFKAFSEGFNKGKSEKRNTFNLTDISDASLMAWNEEIGVIAIGEGIYDEQAVINSFFEPNTDQSLSKNENLLKLLSEKHDVKTWVTSNVIASNKNAKLALTMAKINPEALNDNFIHSYVDFEEGEVVSKTNYFFKDELIADLSEVFKNQVNTDFSAVIPANNLTSFLSLALDFEGLNRSLTKRMQIKMFADFALGSYGLSVKKLEETFDGDIVAATYTGNVNNRQEGLIATKIKDLEKFQALITVAQGNELLTKSGEGRYSLSPKMASVFAGLPNLDMEGLKESQLMVKGDIAIFSSNISLLDQIESGEFSATEQLPTNIKSIVEKNPLGLFVDLSALKRMGIKNENPFKELTMESSSKKTAIKVEMTNKNGNSLNSMLKAANEEFKKNKEQKQAVSGKKS